MCSKLFRAPGLGNPPPHADRPGSSFLPRRGKLAPASRGAYDHFVMHLDPRRRAPRIFVDGFCGVVAKDELRHAALRDLSEAGLRIERPFDPRTARPVVQLEIELPGIDEVVWASGVVTFARLTPMGGRTADGQPRLWCRAGLRIDGIARREQRLLRDYVRETHETRLRAAS